MDPLADFRDLCLAPAPAPAPAPAADLLDAPAVAARVAASAARVFVVCGRPVSGRTTLAAIVRQAVRAARPAAHVAVDTTYEHVAAANATLVAAVERALRLTAPTGVTVLVTLARVAHDAVCHVATADSYAVATLRARYGIGVDRLVRNYHANLVALDNHRALGIRPAQAAHAAARGGAVADPPRTPRALDKWYYRAARRRSSAGFADAFAFADELLTRAAAAADAAADDDHPDAPRERERERELDPLALALVELLTARGAPV
jgi:hypothetical protein